jgi:hypothetical protein
MPITAIDAELDKNLRVFKQKYRFINRVVNYKRTLRDLISIDYYKVYIINNDNYLIAWFNGKPWWRKQDAHPQD